MIVGARDRAGRVSLIVDEVELSFLFAALAMQYGDNRIIKTPQARAMYEQIFRLVAPEYWAEKDKAAQRGEI